MKQTRNYILLFCFVSMCHISLGQKTETKLTLDKIIDHVENNSLYRNNVDWPLLKKEIYVLAENADSVPQLKPALDLMLKKLKDSHGRIFYNNQFLAYHTGPKKEHLKNIDWDVYGDIQTAQVYGFKASVLRESVGYVRIVGLRMGDNEKMSNDIQNAVCNLMEKGVEKWIIDLRYNGGGNMFPMVEGITGIIGDGIVGGTMGVTKEESSVWQIKKGDFFYDEQNVAIENKCPIKETPKVAVLTSNYTASSGEALAVILKNRPYTRFFGNATYGLITATNWMQIDSLTALSISVSYYKDRSDTIYKDYVSVDEIINFEPGVDLVADKAIIRALEWIGESEK